MEDKGKRSYLLVLVGLSFLFLILGVGLYISSKLIANRVTGEPPLQNGDITGPSKRPPIDPLEYAPKPGDPHYPEPLKTQRYTIDEKFTDSLAYLEDGDIYLFDKNGKRKLTEGGNVKQFKWTRSGEEITYLINEVDETKGGGRSVIFRLNVETTEKMVGVEKEIVCEEVKSEFGGDYTRCPQIEDFDLSPDSERLAYGFRGLWVKELNSGTEEQLVKEEISPSPGGTAYLYNPIKVKYNPTREILLLSYSGYEGNTWDQVYDLTTKTTLEIEGMPTSNAPDWIHWTDDGKNILVYTDCYREYGGLWLGSLEEKQGVKVVGLGEKYPCLPISSADYSSKSGLLAFEISAEGSQWAMLASEKERGESAICDTFFAQERKFCFSTDSYKLVMVMEQAAGRVNKLKLVRNITEDNLSNVDINLSFSSTGGKIAFIVWDKVNQTPGLYVVDLVTGREGVLFNSTQKGISQYSWRPGAAGGNAFQQVDEHKEVDQEWNKYTNYKAGYSINYPKQWKFESGKFENKSIQNRAGLFSEVDNGRLYGEIKITDINIAEEDFYNPASDFWPKSDLEGVECGPAIVFEKPKVVTLGNLKSMSQLSYPLCNYGGSKREHLTYTYYVLLDEGEVAVVSYSYDSSYPGIESELEKVSEMLASLELLEEPQR